MNDELIIGTVVGFLFPVQQDMPDLYELEYRAGKSLKSGKQSNETNLSTRIASGHLFETNMYPLGRMA